MSKFDLPDYYKVLNLDFGATNHEIKSSFRILAKKYHPDKNNGNSESEAIFKMILVAYETLSDPKLRFQYDAHYMSQKRSQISNSKSDNTETKRDNKVFQLSDFISLIRITIFGVFVFSLLYTNMCESNTSTGNLKADKQLKEESGARPETGEIQFEK